MVASDISLELLEYSDICVSLYVILDLIPVPYWNYNLILITKNLYTSFSDTNLIQRILHLTSWFGTNKNSLNYHKYLEDIYPYLILLNKFDYVDG